MNYQFKGTQGEWLARNEFGADIVTDDDRSFGICHIGYPSELKDANYPLEEAKYNALLISKAPELFKMLQRIYNGQHIYPEIHK